MELELSDSTPNSLQSKNMNDPETVNVSDDEAVDPHVLDAIYKKLDRRIIPALWTLYFMTSFGGASYGNSLTMNASVGHSMKQNLNLTAHQLSTASALDYVGFIIFDLPMNLAMTRLPPQKWLSRIVISVGFIYACYTALVDGKGLIAIRLFTGIAGAGCWPGMTYYITLWYPSDRTAKRIGYYYTAAQLAYAVAGLVAAGFQKMDGQRGYYGYQWMFLVYGCVCICVGFTLLWWLPDRPTTADTLDDKNKGGVIHQYWKKLTVTPSQPLTPEEHAIHMKDITNRYKNIQWSWKDLTPIIIDIRIWPIIIMYFGVVGTGYGLAVFATTIIAVNNPSLSDIDLSLLYAPIWLFDFAGILMITPFSDKYKKYRSIFFILGCIIIIVGLCVATYAPGSWSRYGGLLICGFGLGPTVPICMTWASAIYAPLYGDVGAASSAALVSGLGNLGSVMTTYALYSGWKGDSSHLYRNSNMVMVAILGLSIIAAVICQIMDVKLGRKRLQYVDNFMNKI